MTKNVGFGGAHGIFSQARASKVCGELTGSALDAAVLTAGTQLIGGLEV